MASGLPLGLNMPRPPPRPGGRPRPVAMPPRPAPCAMPARAGRPLATAAPVGCPPVLVAVAACALIASLTLTRAMAACAADARRGCWPRAPRAARRPPWSAPPRDTGGDGGIVDVGVAVNEIPAGRAATAVAPAPVPANALAPAPAPALTLSPAPAPVAAAAASAGGASRACAASSAWISASVNVKALSSAACSRALPACASPRLAEYSSKSRRTGCSAACRWSQRSSRCCFRAQIPMSDVHSVYPLSVSSARSKMATPPGAAACSTSECLGKCVRHTGQVIPVGREVASNCNCLRHWLHIKWAHGSCVG